MLRGALMLLAALAAAVGLVLAARGVGQPGWPLFGWSCVVLLALAAERWRYRRVERAEGARWQPTGERFEDPVSGETVEVLYDPGSGERRYVPARPRL